MDLLKEEDLKRREISEHVATLAQNETYNIDELITTYGNGLSFYVDVDYYYDDCSVTIQLTANRLETDEEYAARLDMLKVYRAKQAATAERRREANARRKAAKLDKERELYEQLKAKFEKGEG